MRDDSYVSLRSLFYCILFEQLYPDVLEIGPGACLPQEVQSWCGASHQLCTSWGIADLEAEILELVAQLVGLAPFFRRAGLVALLHQGQHCGTEGARGTWLNGVQAQAEDAIEVEQK